MSDNARRADITRERLRAQVAAAARRLSAAASSSMADEVQGEDAEEPFSLTDVQQAYLVGRLDEMQLGGVGSHSYVEIEIDRLDELRFEAALNRLVARHGMLRAVVDGTRQRILSRPPPVVVAVEELSALNPVIADEALARTRRAMSHRRYDPTMWPWFEFRISRLSPAVDHLHVGIDVMMIDGPSLHMLIGELWRLYDGQALPIAPRLTFKGYLERTALASTANDRARDEAYWTRWLDEGAIASPELPLRRGAAASGFGRRSFFLSPEDWSLLNAQTRAIGTPVVSVLLAAYAECLYRWSATATFTLNLTFYDRRPVHPDVHQVIGNFTSIVLLSVRPGEWSDPTQAARVVHRTLWEGLEHRSVSGVEVLRRAARREGGGAAVARAPVVFTSMIGAGAVTAAGRRGQEVFGVSQTPQVLLDCQVVEEDGGLRVVWDALEDAFLPGALDGMFGAFERLVRESWLTELSPSAWTPPLPRPEAHDGAPAPAVRLHDGFLEQARLRPGALAVCQGQESTTYGELLAMAQAVARACRAATPLGPALVCLPAGARRIAAVLGVLIAGRAYVPATVDTPDLRLADMMHLAEACLVLTDSEQGARFKAFETACVLNVEDLPTATERVDVRSDPEFDDLAYIIFTSGSTGRPKGVRVTHAAALNTVAAVNEAFAVGPGDSVLGVSSLAFDLSVYDIFGVLAVGGRLVLPRPGLGQDPDHWLQVLAEHKVTLWNSVPALFQLLVERAEALGHSLGLRLALLSGDWIPVWLPDRAKALAPEMVVVSLGGATEAAIWSVWHRIDAVDPQMSSIPYGRAMPGQRLLVLNGRGEICPPLTAGDLWIDGLGLALGYAGAPDLTAEAFVWNPATQGRMYRTGDRARLLANGELEFLGRRDRQAKLNGHRIELGEIEHVLRSHPAVAAAVVLIVPNAQGQRQLAAWVVPEAGQDPTGLMAHAMARLPAYMVPVLWTNLTELPLTRNGKIDVSRLAATAVAVETPDESAAAVPASPLLAAAKRLFSEVLGDERPLRADMNLMRAGGTSLDAIRLLVHARDVFGAPIPLRPFLIDPTPQTLAALAERTRLDAGGGAPSLPVPVQPHRCFPLSPAQQGLWTLQRADPASTAYNTVDGFVFEGEVEEESLLRALAALIDRHEALRTIFDTDPNGDPVQRVVNDRPCIKCLDSPPGMTLFEQLKAVALDYANRPFDLLLEPAVRLCLVRMEGRPRALVVSMHHIICDAWSLDVIRRDLDALYSHLRDGGPPPAPLAAQPGDLIVWRAEHLDTARFAALADAWQELLAGAPPDLELPRPSSETIAGGARLYFVLDDAVVALLRARAHKASTSLFVVLLDAFATAVRDLAGVTEVVVGVPVADRFHPLAEPLVGLFVNTVPIRLACAPADFSDPLTWTRDQVLAATDLRDLPFQEIVRAINPPRRADRHPLFSVMFALQDVEQGGCAGALPLARVPLELASPKFDLTLECQSLGKGIGGFFEHRPETVAVEFVDAVQAAFMALCRDEPRPVAAPMHEPGEPGRYDAASPPVGLAGFVLDRFRETPEDVAIETPAGAVTYRQLIDRARDVSAALGPRSAGEEEVVAIRGGRTLDVVASALGVLLSGRAFALLDEAQPPERLARMCQIAGVRRMLDHGSTAPGALEVEVLRPARWNAQQDLLMASCRPEAEDLAYVCFTSGTTGEPAAVAVSHRAISARVAWGKDERTVRNDDRVLMLTSIGFDVAICEIFETLACGGRLIISPDLDTRSAQALAALIQAKSITQINVTPSILEELIRDGSESLTSLRRVNCGAEFFPEHLVEKARQALPGVEIYNLYGLTECSVDSTIRRCDAGGETGVGRALAGARIVVVDETGRRVAPGVEGEVCIAGPGVARGYIGRPDLTVKRFVAAPDGGRMYRTGDRGRLTNDGCLQLLGRQDDQIKIRGVRIELAEVSAAFRSHPQVTDCFIDVERSDVLGVRLRALVAGEVSVGGLRVHLSKRLPPAFEPSWIVVVERLPRLVSGKLDRLEARRRLDEAWRPIARPRSYEELEIAAIYGRLLGAPVLDPDADFFELGGHSLLAGRLAVLLGEMYGRPVSIAEVIENATPARLCAHLRKPPATQERSLIDLNGGEGPALVLVHPLGGEAICYLPLARSIPSSRAVKGLRLVGPAPDRFETLIARHADAIGNGGLKGAVRLAGWSAGGLVAQAIAAELEARGVAVQELLLIDTAPFAGPELGEAGILAMTLTELAEGLPPPLEATASLEAAIRYAEAHELLPWSMAGEDLRRRVETATVLEGALRRHDFRPINAPIRMIRAQATSKISLEGWRRLTLGEGRAHTLAGHHYSILREPALGELVGATWN